MLDQINQEQQPTQEKPHLSLVSSSLGQVSTEPKVKDPETGERYPEIIQALAEIGHNVILLRREEDNPLQLTA